MPIITVFLRHGCNPANADGSVVNYLPAYPELVDTDTLSPRARALAEAISACGQQNLDIAMETSDPYVPPEVSAEVLATWGDRLPPHLRDTGAPARKAVRIRRMRADSPRDAAEFLETSAREISREHAEGPDWYPVGACAVSGITADTENVTRVPSADAARSDQYLMRNEVLDRMRKAGRPMAVQAWDTLRQASHLPAPDRYVAGRTPQWRPDTVDAYLDRPRQTWTLSQVAEHLGFGGAPATAAGSARKQLHRWGITASGRAPGRGGESLYDADQVRDAHANRPGRGHRSDLARTD